MAVKQLHSKDETAFRREVEMLKRVGYKNDFHLIKLLATFSQGGNYHLIFPYATANLREYWENRHQQTFDQVTVLWALRQMAGMASALALVHNYRTTNPMPEDGTLRVRKEEAVYGRHGDIKPENILWFSEVKNLKDPMGVLQIADFGLGRFHRQESRSKVDPASLATSPTYMPPEIELRLFVSRKYDLWSLGCLYLEFVTWLLRGYYGVDEFAEARGKVNPRTKIDDDYFFDILSRPDNSHYGEVREGVMTWVNGLHAHEQCSQAIHDLLDLIMTSMVVVDCDHRIECTPLSKELVKISDRAANDMIYLSNPVPRQPQEPQSHTQPDSQRREATNGSMPSINVTGASE